MTTLQLHLIVTNRQRFLFSTPALGLVGLGHFFLITFIYLVCVCVCMHACMHVWHACVGMCMPWHFCGVRGLPGDSGLSFHQVSPRDAAQVIGLRCRCHSLLWSHLNPRIMLSSCPVSTVSPRCDNSSCAQTVPWGGMEKPAPCFNRNISLRLGQEESPVTDEHGNHRPVRKHLPQGHLE